MRLIFSRQLRSIRSLAAFSLLLCLAIPLARADSPVPAVVPELPGPVVPQGLGVNIHFTDPRGRNGNARRRGLPLDPHGFCLGRHGTRQGQV